MYTIQAANTAQGLLVHFSTLTFNPDNADYGNFRVAELNV